MGVVGTKDGTGVVITYDRTTSHYETHQEIRDEHGDESGARGARGARPAVAAAGGMDHVDLVYAFRLELS